MRSPATRRSVSGGQRGLSRGRPAACAGRSLISAQARPLGSKGSLLPCRPWIYRQASEAAEADAPVAFGLSRELQVRKAREKARERDAAFHARDVHPGAGVLAVAERDVAVGLARDVEALGVRELARVAVRRADAEGDEGPCRQRRAARARSER